MNIYGYEKRIREAQEELKIGQRELGFKRFNILEKRIRCWRHCTENLREKRKIKRKS